MSDGKHLAVLDSEECVVRCFLSVTNARVRKAHKDLREYAFDREDDLQPNHLHFAGYPAETIKVGRARRESDGRLSWTDIGFVEFNWKLNYSGDLDNEPELVATHIAASLLPEIADFVKIFASSGLRDPMTDERPGLSPHGAAKALLRLGYADMKAARLKAQQMDAYKA